MSAKRTIRGSSRSVSSSEVLSGVRRLERGLRLAAREVERATGLSAAQLFMLEKLAEGPASSIADLSARTLTDRSSVSVVIDRLAAAGLVKRSPSSEDRRRSKTQITTRGRAILARASESMSALNKELGYTEAPMLFEEGGES